MLYSSGKDIVVHFLSHVAEPEGEEICDCVLVPSGYGYICLKYKEKYGDSMILLWLFIGFIVVAMVTVAVAEKLLVLRGLARSQCQHCQQKLGYRSAMKNHVIFKMLHVQYDLAHRGSATPLCFLHGRQVVCSSCGDMSILNAIGEDCSDSVEDFDNP